MQSKDIVKLVGIIAVALVGIFVVSGFFGERKAKIEAERVEHVRQIEAEEAKVIAAQETEQTEERSQFWQKLVPWGSDEDEGNDTAID